MSRPWLARQAIRAYPAGVRHDRGHEMADAATEAGTASRWWFARELLALFSHGLHRRALEVARQGTGRMIADGLGRGAVWILVFELVTVGVDRLRWGGEPAVASLGKLSLMAAVLLLTLIGLDRPAGLLGLTWVAWRLPDLLAVVRTERELGEWVSHTFLAACFAAMLVRRRRVDPRGLLWLLVPAALILLISQHVAADGRVEPLLPIDPHVIGVFLMFASLGVLATALAALPTDPRLAIAISTLTMYVALQGLWQLPTNELLVWFALPLPLVVAWAVIRTHLLNRKPIRT